MKVNSVILIFLLFIILSCEKPEDDCLFRSDGGLEYNYSDFELYDSSTHIFYFKKDHPEFKTEKSSSFSLMANGTEIYNGIFWPSYSSSLPTGPFIYKSPSFYPEYAFRIEFITIDNKPQDTRNDPAIISALKGHNILHSGLSAYIKSIKKDGSQLTFSFIVTNKDKSDLLILDPDKMGPDLFHYFTNEPIFFNKSENKVFYCSIEHKSPSPWNSWNPDWLSVLRSGDSKGFTFNYVIVSPFTPGDYKVSFEFPGLSGQIARDQLYQGNKRIWLGDITLTRELRIQ